jgi:hypothetical protein
VKYNADNRTAVLNPSDPLPDGQWAVIVEGNSDEDILTTGSLLLLDIEMEPFCRE